MSKHIIWGELPQVTFRTPPTDSADLRTPLQKKAAFQADLVLREIGKDPAAIDTSFMERRNMRGMFRGFDPEKITPNELSRVGKELLSRKLIQSHTAELLDRAGEEFDKQGRVLKGDVRMNALEFLARRIAEMTDNERRGDRYAKMLRPEYVKAIHVLQNLQAFGATGDSYGAIRHKEQVKLGNTKELPDKK